MKYHESLSWILDKKGKFNPEDKYRENIDFVHSLGKKCDCVGWSTLDLDDPDADKILDEIKRFCKRNGWEARGWYERTYPDVKSDWYELQASFFKDATFDNYIKAPTDNGDEISLITIKAYHESTPSPKAYSDICVPERFRNACIKNGIDDVEFCWVQDKGRYAAEQYFHIYPSQLIPRIACNSCPKKSEKSKIDKKKIKLLGGYLPKITDIFSELGAIVLPDCYLAEDMPDGGIAYVFCPRTFSYCGRNKILIHKDTAEMLISEKALSWKDLKSAPVSDSVPATYSLDETQTKPKPSQSYISQTLSDYEKLKSSDRPKKVIGEKDALKVMRKAKSDRKEDFAKRITKSKIEQIADSEHKILLPYYQIADGGQLSDEYKLLSYEESIEATLDFFKELEKEELFQDKPKGIVFSLCANGDAVLLIRDGTVIRFSHEAPEITDNWTSAAQFIFDAITETE